MFDPDRMIADYNAQRNRMLELVRSLRAEDFEKPTACPPWTVKDLVAHMTNSASTVQILMERHDQPNPGVEALNERNDSESGQLIAQSESSVAQTDPALARIGARHGPKTRSRRIQLSRLGPALRPKGSDHWWRLRDGTGGGHRLRA